MRCMPICLVCLSLCCESWLDGCRALQPSDVLRRHSVVEAAAVADPVLAPGELQAKPRLALPYRVGHGFDLHRLEEGPYKLILGGLEIPHDRGCVAHSDGGVCSGAGKAGDLF